ncbi:MAG TPA: hypothetical protein VFT06_00265 [Flavisolibacter sp.]|nr:hypothetical protein [Flavisolibacter sp.]
MKYAIYILIIFCGLEANAQTDSSKLYSYNVALQARDLENIYPIIASSEVYEDMFDLVKAKYKQNNPSGSTLVTLDSVRNDALVGIYTYLMQLQNGLTGAYSNRVRAALKAAPTSTYVINQVNIIDAIWNTQQNAVQAEGQRRFQRKRN